MKTYNVEVEIRVYLAVQVAAESSEEALDKATDIPLTKRLEDFEDFSMSATVKYD